jgi:uncharacterized protein DUF5348
MIEGTLVPSTHSGRYTIEDPNESHDLTSGTVIEVFLGGQWIRGSVGYGAEYAIERSPHNVRRGYYFTAFNGGMCGLCAGMEVRLP